MNAFVVVVPPASEPVSISDVKEHCRIDADNQEPAPDAIVVAVGSSPGQIDSGIHRYCCTFVTQMGETQAGAVSNAVTVSNNKVQLILPIGGSLVTGRKIYRTKAGASEYLLLAVINNNSDTIYIDNAADIYLGAQVPISNTTGGFLLNLLISSARYHAESVLKRYLITQTVDCYLDCFNAWEIKLPPLKSIVSINYVDQNGIEQTIPTDQYLVDAASEPARVTPAYGLVWPIPRYQNNAVRIRFIAGYGNAIDVPQNIKNWMLMRIKTMYEVRDSVTIERGIVVMPETYIDRLLDPCRVYEF